MQKPNAIRVVDGDREYSFGDAQQVGEFENSPRIIWLASKGGEGMGLTEKQVFDLFDRYYTENF